MGTNIIIYLFRVAHRICTSCISCHLVKSGLYRCFALHKCQQKNKVKRKNHNEIITHLFSVQRGRPPQEQTKMQNVQKYFFLWVSNTRQLWWFKTKMQKKLYKHVVLSSSAACGKFMFLLLASCNLYNKTGDWLHLILLFEKAFCYTCRDGAPLSCEDFFQMKVVFSLNVTMCVFKSPQQMKVPPQQEL